MSYRDQIIALAGMFQAAYLVRQIAREGQTDKEPFERCLRSILATDAPTTEAVYGGLDGVCKGLEILSTLYEREYKPRDLELSQYVLGIAHLEKKLRKQPELLDKITTGIARVQAQTETFDLLHENVIANLASIYSETISTLQPRIVVSGEQGYLNDNNNANKVRALLLALMRSAVLWQQKGGGRWQLLFSRGKIMKTASELLAECRENS